MMSLKDRCLEIIIDNFDRYHIAYSTTKDLNEKLRFEFLRRRHSYQFAQRLHYKCSFRVEYVDFIINNYLKILDTEWLQDFPWGVISKKFIEVGPSLEKVHINGKTHPWEELICNLPNVLFLFLRIINNSYLELIAKYCPKIQSIECALCAFTTDGLKHICCQDNGKYPCPELKEILFRNTTLFDENQVTNKDIEYLIKNLPYLEKVEYPNLPLILYSLHKDDINALDTVKPYSLTDIHVDQYLHTQNIDDILKVCVSLCPNLTCFSCTLEKEDHLNLCSQLSKLKNLNLINVQEPPLCLNSFLKLRGSLLTSLRICNFALDVACLLETCRNLNTLLMDGVTFSNNDSRTVSTLSSLKELTFKNFILIDAVTVKAVDSLLSSSSNLESLSFKNVELLCPDLKTAILKCCERNKLLYINFKRSTVDAIFLQNILITCSSLTSLNLEYSDHDHEEIEKLEDIAATLPNTPYILHSDDQNSLFSDYDDFVTDDVYDDFFQNDEDTDDYDYSDDEYEPDYYNDESYDIFDIL